MDKRVAVPNVFAKKTAALIGRKPYKETEQAAYFRVTEKELERIQDIIQYWSEVPGDEE